MQKARLENVEALGWFGRDLQGEYTEDESQVLQYLKLPEGLDWDKKASLNVDWDLNLSCEEDEARYNGTTYEHVLQWITRHCRNQQGEPAMPDVDFVCKRRHLAELMEAAQSRKFWYLLAKRVQGVIHFYIFWDETDDKESMEEKERTKLLPWEKYGNKFEHYLLADTRDGTADPSRPIRRYDDMAMVYRAKLGGLSILYAGEIDGLPDDVDLQNLNAARLVELKTAINPKKWHMPKWWAQCMLSKCERLLLGMRDDQGHVYKLKWLTLDQIGSWQEGWSKESMVGWAQRALNIISSVMRNSEDGQVRMFEKTARGLVLSAEDPPQYTLDQFFPEFYEQWTNTAQARPVPEEVATPSKNSYGSPLYPRTPSKSGNVTSSNSWYKTCTKNSYETPLGPETPSKSCYRTALRSNNITCWSPETSSNKGSEKPGVSETNWRSRTPSKRDSGTPRCYETNWRSPTPSSKKDSGTPKSSETHWRSSTHSKKNSGTPGSSETNWRSG